MGFKARARRGGSTAALGSRKSPEVEAWFQAADHPLEPVIRRVREIILSADPRMSECLKWKCPTFTYKGNLASINPRAKRHVSLMFHRGAYIPGDHPHLEGGGSTARYMRFASVDEVEARKPDLEAVVRAWCDWQPG